MFPVTTRIGALVLVLLMGCSQELSRPVAEDLIAAHLVGLTPNLPDSLRSTVVVGSVIQVDDFTRETRINIIFRADTVPASAFFRESDDGWALVEYGPNFKNTVASLVTSDVRGLYIDLLDVLDRVNVPLQAWVADFLDRSDVARRAQGVSGDEWVRLFDLARDGPSEEVSRTLVSDAGVVVPEGVYWSLEQSEYFAPILWVASDPDRGVWCGQVFNYSSKDVPPEFFGIDDMSGSYCTGRRRAYSLLSTYERTLALIEEGGGILLNP